MHRNKESNMVAADKEALWDAYLAAATNQDRADHDLAVAVEALRYATQRAKNCERYADDAHDAWERA